MKNGYVVGVLLLSIMMFCQMSWAQNPGDIIVTEIIPDPAAVSDGNGEWFEIYNKTASAIDIDGWVIRDAGSNNHTINNGGPLTIDPGDFLVLGNNGDSGTNGGYTADYVYSSFSLGNADDEVILEFNGVVIDSVGYDGGVNFPNPTGASMVLKDLTADNDDGANWTESTTPWPGSAGDLGSPGFLGDDAVVPVELSSFSAAEQDGGILLTWMTQTETENLGFHVFRTEQEDGQYRKITETIIPGAGNSAVAHSYSYLDADVQSGVSYYYKLADVDFGGQMEFHGPVSASVGAIPTEFVLNQNYPNPFNPNTTITFSLPAAAKVKLTIYDINGQLVRTLMHENLDAGNHKVMWNATDENGLRVATGVYVVRLISNDVVQQRKMVLVK